MATGSRHNSKRVWLVGMCPQNDFFAGMELIRFERMWETGLILRKSNIHAGVPMSEKSLSVSGLLAGLMLLAVLPFSAAKAQDTPIPLATVKQAINATKANWIAFRNYDGQQLLYLTQLLTWKCGLREIRYGLNSSHLGDVWPLPVCNPQTPYQLDPNYDHIYVNYPLDSLKFVSVQVVFADGATTDVMTYTPCDVANEVSCAALIQ